MQCNQTINITRNSVNCQWRLTCLLITNSNISKMWTAEAYWITYMARCCILSSTDASSKPTLCIVNIKSIVLITFLVHPLINEEDKIWQTKISQARSGIH